MFHPLVSSRRRFLARAARGAVLAGLLASGIPASAHAVPGDLDGTFGGMTSVVPGDVLCHAIAPDGKIVLAGNNGIALLVTRRLSNGDTDYSFGSGGSKTVSNLAYAMVIRSVAVQADGKILLAGYTDVDFPAFLVVRLTASGSPDPTWSGDGFVTVPISYSNSAEKVLVQPDGKIIAVGTSWIGGDPDFAAVRFNTNGTLDPTWGGDGIATIGFGGNDECHSAILQGDGKLLLVGGSSDFNFKDEDFAVARLHPNGTLDGSWDGDGKLKTGFGDVEAGFTVAIQPTDLRIVVAGRGKAARYYSSDGSLDDSFDGDGKLSVPFNVYGSAITVDGKIHLTGSWGGTARAIRLNSNGTPDTGWHGTGEVVISLNSNFFEPPSHSLLPDGRLLTVVPRGTDCELGLLWPDGTSDIGGKQALAWDDVTFGPGSHEIAHDLAILPDGKIVVAGEVSTPGYTETDFALSRFHADGRLDDSFGIHGRAALSLGDLDYAKAMVVQPDGKIVVAGYTGTGNATNFMIARFNANGSLDNTFGFGGFNALDFMGGADYGWAVALQPDGKIVVAGTVFNGARNVFGVARFTTDGVKDNTFDTDGKQLIEFSVGLSHWASAVLVQPLGRIVVGGNVGGNFGLVGLNPNGSLDTFFGTSGKTTRDLGGSEYLEALVMGTDGRIYAAGTRVLNGNADWVLSRWTGSAGLWICNPVCPWTSAFVDFGATSGWVDAMDVRGDGHIVLTGIVGGTARWAQFAPGSQAPDASGQFALPGNATAGYGVRFDGPHRLVVAGYHSYQGDHNMALARFETLPNLTVGVEDEAPLGPSVRLAPPAPNPLTSRTTFAFDLPRAEPVRLAIHDASGRLVRTLADGPFAAGRHQRPWDGADDGGRRVAPGVYFARLVAGPERAVRSVVVLR